MTMKDKTEKPTPRRLRQARKEGRLPRSPEVGSWATLLAATWLVPHTISLTRDRAQGLLVSWTQVTHDPQPAVAIHLLRETLVGVLVCVAPLALGVLVVGLAANAAQGGIHMASKAARPKLARVNPWKGLRRLFSMTSWVEAGKSLLKAAVVGVLAWHSVRGLVETLTASGSPTLSDTVGSTWSALLSLVRATALVGLVIAAGDYAYKRRTAMKQLKMTKQEIKEEHRQSEGDPHLRSAIRSRQLAISRNRMMAEIAKADVVVVNPTHVAVALRYARGSAAPVVIAKGAGVIAAAIRARAEEHEVPMVTDVPLARTIYKLCRIGDPVPPELYQAVARILAYVYALRSRRRTPTPALAT